LGKKVMADLRITNHKSSLQLKRMKSRWGTGKSPSRKKKQGGLEGGNCHSKSLLETQTLKRREGPPEKKLDKKTGKDLSAKKKGNRDGSRGFWG